MEGKARGRLPVHTSSSDEVGQAPPTSIIARLSSGPGRPFHVVTRSVRIHSATPSASIRPSPIEPRRLGHEERRQHGHVDDREGEGSRPCGGRAVAPRMPPRGAGRDSFHWLSTAPWDARSSRSCSRSRPGPAGRPRASTSEPDSASAAAVAGPLPLVRPDDLRDDRPPDVILGESSGAPQSSRSRTPARRRHAVDATHAAPRRMAPWKATTTTPASFRKDDRQHGHRPARRNVTAAPRRRGRPAASSSAYVRRS